MARVNFEDSIYLDERFHMLVGKVSDLYRAKGMLVHAFELAQRYWKSHRAIPADKFPAALEVLIEVDFCQRSLAPDGTSFVYVRGSSDACSFLDQRSQAGSKTSEKKTAAARQNLAKANEARKNSPESLPTDANGSQRECERMPTLPTSVSSSSSGSSSGTSSRSTSHSGSGKKEQSKKHSEERPAGAGAQGKLLDLPPKPSGAQEFIARYCESFKEVYGTNPAITGRESAAATTIVKALGLETALLIPPVYLAMRDAWFITKRHALTVLSENLNAVKIKLETGATITRREAVQAEGQVSTKNQMERMMARYT